MFVFPHFPMVVFRIQTLVITLLLPSNWRLLLPLELCTAAYYPTPISVQIQLQIPLSTYPLTLISGQIPPTYLPPK
eukprot:Pgem_evm1s1745